MLVNTAPGFNSISQEIRMSMSDHAKASDMLPKGILVNIEEVVISQRWRTILLTSKTVLPLINK